MDSFERSLLLPRPVSQTTTLLVRQLSGSMSEATCIFCVPSTIQAPRAQVMYHIPLCSILPIPPTVIPTSDYNSCPCSSTRLLLCVHFPHTPYVFSAAILQVLRERRGFVRLALQTGASLVPVLAFGETDTFHTHIPAPRSTAALVMRCLGGGGGGGGGSRRKRGLRDGGVGEMGQGLVMT